LIDIEGDKGTGSRDGFTCMGRFRPKKGSRQAFKIFKLLQYKKKYFLFLAVNA
jgi:hypothetical protein